MNTFKKLILRQIKKRGYEIAKVGHSDRVSVAYRKIFAQFDIDHVIDVGANEGQYAQSMRRLGYTGHISSFEPLLDVFEKLKVNSVEDSNWQVANLALGNKDEQQEINVSKNTVSSSILEILPEHIKNEPGSIFIRKEKVNVKKIDTIWKEISFGSSNVFLKLDVQGYEKFVLEGAAESLKYIKVIQVEMALTALYSGELLLADMVYYMEKLDYVLYSLINGFNNFETGQLFQVDGIFVRKDLIH